MCQRASIALGKRWETREVQKRDLGQSLRRAFSRCRTVMKKKLKEKRRDQEDHCKERVRKEGEEGETIEEKERERERERESEQAGDGVRALSQ